MKRFNLKANVKNTIVIITKKISRAETKLSIQTQMKLLGLAEKEQGRIFDRRKTSELKRHFNNIVIRLEKVQELKYKMQELIVIPNKNMGKTDKFSENLVRDVARFCDVLARLDETIKGIVDGEYTKEKFRADEEEEDKFRRRLYEETKIEKMRIQMKIDYDNKE